MLRQGRLPAGLVIAGALVAAMACTDRRTPTSPLTPSDGPSAALGGAGRVKIRMLNLSSNTLRIDGPAVSASLSIANSGPSAQSGISIRAEVTQPAANRQAANLPVQCGSSNPAGVVPDGNCDMTLAITTSNSAPGGGTLVPGAAVVVFHLLQTVNGVETELNTRNLDVNLVATPVISAVTLTPTTLAIDGPAASWSATLQNPTNKQQGVALQGTIVQGATRRAAGGVLVSCGSAFGVLPSGACTVSFTASASHSGSGNGFLSAGPASFELKLTQTTNGITSTLDTRTVAVTLVFSTPSIASVVMSSTSLVIGGASVDYTVQVQNWGFPQTDIGLQGEIVQGTGTSTVRTGAGGFSVTCGGAVGALPTTSAGTCTMQLTATATGSTAFGVLVPGPARFVLNLYKATANGPIEFDEKTVNVTLLSSNPTITSIDPASTFIVLDAGFTSYTATIQNPGAPRSIVSLQNWIRQGSARRAAAGTQVRCAGSPNGELPTGSCTTAGDIVAANGQAGGSGTLVPGAATLETELKYYDGTTEVILDTKTMPITLVASTPSIVSISFTTTTIAIGGQARYTATLYNPTSATLTDALIQGYITQGANTAPAGGTSITCPTLDEVAPGSCVVSFTINPNNANSFPGPLVAGSATFRLEFRSNGTVLDSQSVPITLQ